MKEKRNEEERIKAMKEFAFKKSIYNSNMNKTNETKEMIDLYKVLVKKKIKEEEERRIKEEEERKRKEEEERKRKEEEERKRIGRRR